MFIYPIYNHNWRNISAIYIYITRLPSKEIFSPWNKIHRKVGRAKDLSALLYIPSFRINFSFGHDPLRNQCDVYDSLTCLYSLYLFHIPFLPSSQSFDSLYHGRPTFLLGKGPRTFLWSVSRTAIGQITSVQITVTFIWLMHNFTNVAAKYTLAARGL
jgi:hypothetical protein